MDPVGYEFCTPEGDKGGGVRATRGFDVGETVMVGELEGDVDRNDSHATQISRTKWARHGGLGPIVNHSCDPNCGCEVNATGACDFVARERIVAGDEITFDYAMRNYSIEFFPGGCLCEPTSAAGRSPAGKTSPTSAKLTTRAGRSLPAGDRPGAHRRAGVGLAGRGR